MKKFDLLIMVSSLAILTLAGCESDSSTGDVSANDSSSSTWDENAENASGSELGDVAESGNRIEGNKRRGLFNPVHFEFDSASLSSSEKSKLNKVGEYLESNPGSKLLVEGNCDQSGTPEYNRALGQRRAAVARSYLVGKGISADRIGTVSYGEDKPVGSDSQNRRDDFVIVD